MQVFGWMKLFAVVSTLCVAAVTLPAESTSASAASVVCRGVYDKSNSAGLLSKLQGEGYGTNRPDECGRGYLSGEIIKGDSEQLQSFIEANLPFIGGLTLDSPGGDLFEAMKMGRLIHRYLLATYTPMQIGSSVVDVDGTTRLGRNSGCYSACVIVYLGGVQRWGSILGIHRRYPPAETLRSVDPARSERIYSELKRALMDYFQENAVPLDLLNQMMNVPSGELEILAQSEIARLEANPGVAEWLTARCGAVSKAEMDEGLGLAREQLNGATSAPARKARLDFLNKRTSSILGCRAESLVLARWKIGRDGRDIRP